MGANVLGGSADQLALTLLHNPYSMPDAVADSQTSETQRRACCPQ